MKYEVEDKIFVNEAGNQIKYKRLVITGYLDGNIEQMELPISKDQATIYKMMKSQGHTVEVKKGGSVNSNRSGENSLLDDDEKGLFD